MPHIRFASLACGLATKLVSFPKKCIAYDKCFHLSIPFWLRPFAAGQQSVPISVTQRSGLVNLRYAYGDRCVTNGDRAGDGSAASTTRDRGQRGIGQISQSCTSLRLALWTPVVFCAIIISDILTVSDIDKTIEQ